MLKMISGVDLIRTFRVAGGERLTLKQEDIQVQWSCH
ncbi:hypothetical protein KF913_23145 [Candidatus Obscuribacterales bacterium]|nr:hypothetical protein [Candidatus Obscuribacterales bacterium]